MTAARGGVRLLVFLLPYLNLLAATASSPPGPGPFGNARLPQPVPGAARATTTNGWKKGKVCDVTMPPYSAANGSNATLALRAAIRDCGDLASGGTVLVPAGIVLYSASLWLRSNLTLRVEAGAALVSTATGSGRARASTEDAPIVYTRRGDTMVWAHAGFLNGALCTKLKSPLVGWDDCAEWSVLSNVVIEGGGMLDADGDAWWSDESMKSVGNARPMMLDLLWIDGLTIRDMQIRRPGYWTVHPTFSNNVRITGNSIITKGHNTDGCDPDSSWNVYIEGNTFSTGDDCIAIKAGKDWSGRKVNISTQNVLVERNIFKLGHGVSIGSETSGWVRNITIRDSVLDGTNLAVRIKSMRGRGGGVEDVLYENLSGSTVSGIQLTLKYKKGTPPTNVTATPTFRRITVRNVTIRVDESALDCEGLDDSNIEGVVFEGVTMTGKGAKSQECNKCEIVFDHGTSPKPKC